MRSDSARRWVWLAALVFCAAGVLLAGQLSQKHIRQGFGEGSFLGRMCQEGTANCDEVIRSPWGTALGVPTAVWGMAYFAAAGLWFLLCGLPNRGGRAWHLLAVLGTGVGLAVAAWLDFVMFVKLPHWCPLCFATHILAMFVFVAAILMWPTPPGEAVPEPVAVPPPSPNAMRVGLTLAAILIAGIAIHENFQHRRFRAEAAEAGRLFEAAEMSGSAEGVDRLRAALADCQAELAPFNENLRKLIDRTQQQEAKAAALRVEEPRKGNPQSNNVVVVFNDFECPNCLAFADFWRQELEPAALEKAQLVFRYYPMNTACNKGISRTLHEKSCESAFAAEAARLQGGTEAFWKMHDALFRNQGRVGAGRLSYRSLADQIGLDGAKLEKDMAGPAVREKVTADIRLGQQLGVRGTPTVFLNGRQLPVVGNERLWRHYLQLPRPAAESRPAEAP